MSSMNWSLLSCQTGARSVSRRSTLVGQQMSARLGADPSLIRLNVATPQGARPSSQEENSDVTYRYLAVGWKHHLEWVCNSVMQRTICGGEI